MSVIHYPVSYADSLMVAFYCHSCLFQLLDEVQSYILVERSIKHNNAAVADSMAPEFLYMVSGFIPLLLSCILLM